MSLINPNPLLIEDKEKLEDQFLAFLRELNYPEDSIFRGPSFQLKEAAKWRNILFDWMGQFAGEPPAQVPRYADLAVLDLETCEYACVVEFQLRLDEHMESRLAASFQEILDCTQTKPPVFLVVPGSNAGFRIFQLRENGVWQELPKKHFPHYPTLVAGLEAERSLVREVKQTRELDRFNIACHVLAGIIALVIIANISGLSKLTSAQMSLLIIAALLVVAPHAAAFRLAGSRARQRLFKVK